MEIFNNWKIIAKGWYIACPSRDIAIGRVKSLDLCGQRLALFRAENGQVYALNAYCPHLGTDLGLGFVEGQSIRCRFHHWAFDGTGHCQGIPCQTEIPSWAKVPSYATAEAYGFIWVYPDRVAPFPVPEFDQLKGKAMVTQADRPLSRSCHHHICMMNGIDVQHLSTVHGLTIEMNLDIAPDPSGHCLDFTLTGSVPQTTLQERLLYFFLGPTYSYSMRYAQGCIGLLTLCKNVKLLPPLYMLYAYQPQLNQTPDRLHQSPSRTQIWPIYVTERRSGLLGFFVSQFLLLLTRLAYYRLRGEDGEIYDNIQFHPHLLAIDRPLKVYRDYVNQLEPSGWSQSS